MLRDVVRAGAVELDEHVVYGVLQRLFDVCADRGYRGREGAQRWRLVGWVAVDWVAGRWACRREGMSERERERGVSVVGWQEKDGVTRSRF